MTIFLTIIQVLAALFLIAVRCSDEEFVRFQQDAARFVC